MCFLTSGAWMRSALMHAWMRAGSEKEAKKACFERKALNSFKYKKELQKVTKMLLKFVRFWYIVCTHRT